MPSQKLKTTLISSAELLDRFSYYGLQSLLILYLSKQLGFTDKQSYEIFGIYAALPLGLSVLGGAIADRKLGAYWAAMVGCFLVILGNVVLAFQQITYLYLGLATLMVGIGLLKPNNANLLGDLYKENTSQREKAYSLFYLCINFGAIFGPIFYGIFSQQASYQTCFYISAVLMSGALIALLFLRKNVYLKKINLNDVMQSLFLIFSLVASAFGILIYSQYFGFVIIGAFILASLILFKFIQKENTEKRFSLLFLLAPIAGCIIYFACLQQIYSSLLIFVDRLMNKEILGFHVPVSFFSALEPCCLFLMVPVLNLIWKKWNIEHQKKIFIGLVSAGLSFIFFALAAFCVNYFESYSLFLILIGNIFLSVGELCIFPVIISLINLIAPQKHKGIYMGVFYFSLTLSGYLAGLMAQFAPVDNATNSFVLFFISISGLLFMTGLIINFMSTLQKKL